MRFESCCQVDWRQDSPRSAQSVAVVSRRRCLLALYTNRFVSRNGLLALRTSGLQNVAE